ncbi:MAG TPA: TetR/AcrR family transcriptional regulator [Telluria sp.]|nr:TetR/AcrR family transcriptional regulator [Telluria sp.]
MSARIYDNSRRKQSEAATIERIVEATVGLHAEKGALATSHADIAQAAGVSVATVYKHFPSRDALIPYCTGLVQAQAPAIDADLVLAGADPQERIARLVRAVHAHYAFMHPWMRWSGRDVPALPALQRIVQEGQAGMESRLRALLAECCARPLAETDLALALALLDYSTWEKLGRLLGDAGRSAQAVGRGLCAILLEPPVSKGKR